MSPAPPTELRTREETHHEISRRSWGLENETYVQMNGASCIRLEDNYEEMNVLVAMKIEDLSKNSYCNN